MEVDMAKHLAWIGATVIALAGIVIGVLPIDTGPRWVWLTIGIAFGLLAAFTSLTVWRSNDQAGAPTTNKKVEQKPTMTAGKTLARSSTKVAARSISIRARIPESRARHDGWRRRYAGIHRQRRY